MSSRGVRLGLLLVLPACNFSIEPSYIPPEPADAGQDAARPTDAGAEAGPDAWLSHWCREVCAVDDGDTCRRVTCADASVCVDDPPCDRCVFCHDQ